MLDPATASVITSVFVGIASKLGATHVEKGLASLSEKFKLSFNGWKEEDYYKAAKTYTDELTHLYGHIRVIGMDKPLSLEGVYTDVNILTKLTSSYRLSEKLAEDIFLGRAGYGKIAEKDRGKDGLEVLRNHDKLFLLGKPGAGKTTFLKHALHQAIEGKLFSSQEVIPVFIPLKVWSESGKSLLDFIVQQFDICHFPDAQPFIESILIEGNAIILCDGLDEVMKETRLKCITELNDFSNKYHMCPFVISCRIAATDYRFEKFTYVEMADFNPEQVKTFVRQWFSIQGDPTKSVTFFEELDRSKCKGLKELANTPLLLAMLCLSFGANLTFPSRLAEIYSDAIDSLLQKWYKMKGLEHESVYKNLDLKRKKFLFQKIAAFTFEESRSIFPKKYIEDMLEGCLRSILPIPSWESIDSASVLKAIESQHGVLLETAKEFYSFSHLTIQEFFAAMYMIHPYGGSLSSLIQHHHRDVRWREIYIRTAELLTNADNFFRIFIITLDRVCQDNPRLSKLIRYAVGVVASSPTPTPRLAIKSAIVLQVLCTARALDFARPRDLDLALERAIERARALSIDRDFAISLDRDFDLDFNLALTLALALDRALDRVTANARAHSLAINIAFASDYLSKAIMLGEELGLKELCVELGKLAVPSDKASDDDWRRFANSLERILRKHRSVEQYEFTMEEANIIADYLYGVKLLLDCLEVAYVTDREGIKNRLLRVPE